MKLAAFLSAIALLAISACSHNQPALSPPEAQVNSIPSNAVIATPPAGYAGASGMVIAPAK